jgi:hypothetical protein
MNGTTTARPKNTTHPRLLPHYPAVVELAWHERFILARQVQHFFADTIRAKSTLFHQLNSLIHFGYLTRTHRRQNDPSLPTIYQATRKGLTFVQRHYADRGVFWPGGPVEPHDHEGVSDLFLDHEHLCTDFDLALYRTVAERPDISLAMHDRRFGTRPVPIRYDHAGEAHTIEPDIGFLTTAAHHQPLLTFVEVDRGTKSGLAVLRQLQAYERWAATDASDRYLAMLYQENGCLIDTATHPDFRILVIAQDSRRNGDDASRLVLLFQRHLSLNRFLRHRTWFTTAHAIQVHQHEAAPLAAPIWIRGKDARSWITEYHAFTQQLPTSPGHAPLRLRWQMQFVRQHLKAQRRWALFPPPMPWHSNKTGPLLRDKQLAGHPLPSLTKAGA